MKKLIIIIMILMGSYNLKAAEFPYPIIFVHGLDSQDSSWYKTIYLLNLMFDTDFDKKDVFHAVLNAYPDMTNIAGKNNKLGDLDDDVIYSFQSPKKNNIYTINFNNYWNENVTNPLIYLYPSSQNNVKTGESKSNQSSIVKQGYALSLMMNVLVKQLGIDKVILLGHSMGGLCSREYLQRHENGKPKWWVDPNDANGHHVAKFVTIGTPHLGSNFGSLGKTEKNQNEIQIANTSSEAARDLRYSYTVGGDGRFLFGGLESELNSLPSYLGGWHNRDVDCNGYENDYIEGLVSHINKHPLPTNVSYHWITSNGSGLSGDFVVALDRQWLKSTSGLPYPVGITDTTLTHTGHTAQTEDVYAIVRGLDEPGTLEMAYELKLYKTYIQTVTHQQDYYPFDFDVFYVNLKPVDYTNKDLVIIYDDKISQKKLNRKINVKLFNDKKELLLNEDFTNSSILNKVMYKLDKSKIYNDRIYIQTKIEAKEDEWFIPINFKVDLKNTTSVSDDNHEYLGNVYPNPVNSELNVPLVLENKFVNWSIYNLVGDKIEEGDTFVNKNLKIDVSKLIHGSYYIIIKNEGKNQRFSFIKE